MASESVRRDLADVLSRGLPWREVMDPPDVFRPNRPEPIILTADDERILDYFCEDRVATVAEAAAWLNTKADRLRPLIKRMVRKSWLEPAPDTAPAQYRITEQGRKAAIAPQNQPSQRKENQKAIRWSALQPPQEPPNPRSVLKTIQRSIPISELHRESGPETIITPRRDKA